METPQSREFCLHKKCSNKILVDFLFGFFFLCCGNKIPVVCLTHLQLFEKNTTQDVKAPTRKAEKRCARLTIVEGMVVIRLDGISHSPPGVFSKENYLKMKSIQMKYSFYPKCWEVFLEVVEKLPGSTDWSMDVVSSNFSEILAPGPRSTAKKTHLLPMSVQYDDCQGEVTLLHPDSELLLFDVETSPPVPWFLC